MIQILILLLSFGSCFGNGKESSWDSLSREELINSLNLKDDLIQSLKNEFHNFKLKSDLIKDQKPTSYDYIVGKLHFFIVFWNIILVGMGTSGSIIAANLAKANFSVLIIEGGNPSQGI
jgi:hypothetical protein